MYASPDRLAMRQAQHHRVCVFYSLTENSMLEMEILATESLGVRGLCCFVKTRNRSILIDPGVALGYMRHKLLPHPAQVAVDEMVQKRIKDKWPQATDIIISHFHGDHVPLVDANPYQLAIAQMNTLRGGVRMWAKNPENLSSSEHKRAENMHRCLKRGFVPAEGRNYGDLVFSNAVPHGAPGSKDTVMMTRVKDGDTFVHASDIQLLSESAVEQIISWEPDIVLASGPPFYLQRLSRGQIEAACHNVRRLLKAVGVLILDHHVLRSEDGLRWLEMLAQTTGKLICGADFMGKPRLLLEAMRERLYQSLPVPENWHGCYANGEATPTTQEYWDEAVRSYLYRNEAKDSMRY